eukprot:5841070-Prymnesium_polylepis.1
MQAQCDYVLRPFDSKREDEHSYFRRLKASRQNPALTFEPGDKRAVDGAFPDQSNSPGPSAPAAEFLSEAKPDLAKEDTTQVNTEQKAEAAETKLPAAASKARGFEQLEDAQQTTPGVCKALLRLVKSSSQQDSQSDALLSREQQSSQQHTSLREGRSRQEVELTAGAPPDDPISGVPPQPPPPPPGSQHAPPPAAPPPAAPPPAASP